MYNVVNASFHRSLSTEPWSVNPCLSHYIHVCMSLLYEIAFADSATVPVEKCHKGQFSQTSGRRVYSSNTHALKAHYTSSSTLWQVKIDDISLWICTKIKQGLFRSCTSGTFSRIIGPAPFLPFFIFLTLYFGILRELFALSICVLGFHRGYSCWITFQ